MLSLKQNIYRLDREERQFRAALGALLKAVSVLRELPLPAEPEVSRAYREALREIEFRIGDGRDEEALERSVDSVGPLVQEFCAAAGAASAKKEEDLWALVEALGDAAQILVRQHSGQAERLSSFTSKLQGTARIDDPGLMRRQIAGHVRDLRAIAEQAQRENDSGVSALQRELSEFRSRLDLAERRASLDVLTGLLNRGEGESRLNAMIAQGGPLCVILMDLNGFKRINDTWGHAGGDQILKICGRILSSCVHCTDVVCRWGGDEFLVALPCCEEAARGCAARIDLQLRAPLTIVISGKMHHVSTSASLGIAEHAPGECAHDLIVRADVEMYRNKRSASPVAANPP